MAAEGRAWVTVARGTAEQARRKPQQTNGRGDGLGELRQADESDTLGEAQQESQQTGKPARRLKDFTWSTLKSWSRERRVIAKAEWTGGETRALSSRR